MPKPISTPTARQGIQIGDRLMVECEDGLFYKSVVIGLSEKSINILFDSGGEQAEISRQAATDPVRGICALDQREWLDAGLSGEKADQLLQAEHSGQGDFPGMESAAPQGRPRRRRRTREEIAANKANAPASLEHNRPSGVVDGMGGQLKGYRNKLAALPTLTLESMMAVFRKANPDDLTEAQSAIYGEFHDMRQLEEAFPDKLPSLDPNDYDACRAMNQESTTDDLLAPTMYERTNAV